MVSAYDKVGGIVWIPRMLRKIRLRAEGKLPDDYQPNMGRGFDGRCCRFLGISYDKLVEQVLKGGTDQEVFAWCLENGTKPTEDQIQVWNEFMIKRGWRDTDSPPGKLQEHKEKAGMGNRPDIVTFFDFYDVDEGRKP
jgi:gluconokinase